MTINHKRIQRKLMDIYFSDGKMPSDLSEHLKKCSKCLAFWQGMNTLKENIPEIEPPAQADERIIQDAFQETDTLRHKQRDLKDHLLFIGLALFAAVAIYLLAMRGYGIYIIMVQLVFMLVAPFAVLFLIKRRLSKEAY